MTRRLVLPNKNHKTFHGEAAELRRHSTALSLNSAAVFQTESTSCLSSAVADDLWSQPTFLRNFSNLWCENVRGDSLRATCQVSRGRATSVSWSRCHSSQIHTHYCFLSPGVTQEIITDWRWKTPTGALPWWHWVVCSRRLVSACCHVATSLLMLMHEGVGCRRRRVSTHEMHLWAKFPITGADV